MISGLDSSFTRPNTSQCLQALAAGVKCWGGYLSTKPNVGLAAPWAQADFAVVQAAGLGTIAYCSGQDDPVACKALAAQWKVLLCLDVESGIRPDGTWVQPWLNASGAGLYGNYGVHLGRTAAFHVMAGYPGHNPGVVWPGDQPRPVTPLGWQWQGSHTEFGLTVDRGNFDDWFGQQQQPPQEDNDMALIINVDQATVPAGTPWPGVFLLSGSMYEHIHNVPDENSLTAAGVKTAILSYSMHESLLNGASAATNLNLLGILQKLATIPTANTHTGTISGTLTVS